MKHHKERHQITEERIKKEELPDMLKSSVEETLAYHENYANERISNREKDHENIRELSKKEIETEKKRKHEQPIFSTIDVETKRFKVGENNGGHEEVENSTILIDNEKSNSNSDSDSDSSSDNDKKKKKSKSKSKSSKSKSSKKSSKKDESEDDKSESESDNENSNNNNNLSTNVFRAIKNVDYEDLQPVVGWTEAPCGRCPIFEFCEENGPVNASNCRYFDDWLEGQNIEDE